MTDGSKVPPPPWGKPTPAPDTGAKDDPSGPAAGEGGPAWPSLDELAGNGVGGPGAAPTQPQAPAPPPAADPGAAPWDTPVPTRSTDPAPDPIPLDEPRGQAPSSLYAGADDGPPPELPQRVSPPTAADPGRPQPPSPADPASGAAGRPIRHSATAQGAAGQMIRTSATPMWRIVTFRLLIPAVLLLVVVTVYHYWATKSAFKTQVDHGAIMGFDANILDSIEAMAAENNYQLGKDGTSGWILGQDRRWVISIHVRMRAFVVVPYYTHLEFRGDLPYNMHVETHLDHFVDDMRWSFDEAIIQQYQMMNMDKPGLEEELKALRLRIAPPP